MLPPGCTSVNLLVSGVVVHTTSLGMVPFGDFSEVGAVAVAIMRALQSAVVNR